MRVSSNQMFSQVSESILKQEAEFSRLVEQMSTGRRILSAGDDPLAASQAVNVAGALSQANAFKSNRASADQALNAQESALGSATTTMQSVLE
ncbi:MAG: flagellar hook-associated protein 3, partial [Burkholderiaceae bacterium]|nr:flagellar hook-associated protein 3 [Burkholderiaceae bacterium]